MEKSKDRVIARWFNGKLAVLDITETGRQIGEKLAVLLNAEQQINLANYLLFVNEKGSEIIRFTNKFDGVRENTLTEIYEGDLYLCLEQRLVKVHEQEIVLTAKEFDILFLLAGNPNRVFTYELIMDLVWNEDYGADFPRRLRKTVRIGRKNLPNCIRNCHRRNIGQQEHPR